MKELHFFADSEIFKVVSLNGDTVTALDSTGWGVMIPLERVERFCDSEGKNLEYKPFPIDELLNTTKETFSLLDKIKMPTEFEISQLRNKLFKLIKKYT